MHESHLSTRKYLINEKHDLSTYPEYITYMLTYKIIMICPLSHNSVFELVASGFPFEMYHFESKHPFINTTKQLFLLMKATFLPKIQIQYYLLFYDINWAKIRASLLMGLRGRALMTSFKISLGK